MIQYTNEIIEEHKDLIDKYVFETINTLSENLYFVKYYLGRDYTFGFDFIRVLFISKFEALVFILKHKDQCAPKK